MIEVFQSLARAHEGFGKELISEPVNPALKNPSNTGFSASISVGYVSMNAASRHA